MSSSTDCRRRLGTALGDICPLRLADMNSDHRSQQLKRLKFSGICGCSSFGEMLTPERVLPPHEFTFLLGGGLTAAYLGTGSVFESSSSRAWLDPEGQEQRSLFWLMHIY